MKTNYVSMERRYELAHRQAWAETADWQQQVIKDHLKRGESDGRHYQDFIERAVLLAEDTSVELSDTHEAVDLKTTSDKVASSSIV